MDVSLPKSSARTIKSKGGELETVNGPAASQVGTYIEIVNKNLKIGRIQSVLFDFDGTISVIREGWQDIMVPMMVEELMKTPKHEDEAILQDYVREYVYLLTGKDTIYQMIRLAEEVEKRGLDRGRVRGSRRQGRRPHRRLPRLK